MSTARDRTWNVVAGALEQAIEAHGPITKKLAPSAVKRIVAQLPSAADAGARLLDPEGDENTLRQAAYEALAKRHEKLKHGHARLVDQHTRLQQSHRELLDRIKNLGIPA